MITRRNFLAGGAAALATPMLAACGRGPDGSVDGSTLLTATALVAVLAGSAYAKQLVFCSEASPAHFDPGPTTGGKLYTSAIAARLQAPKTRFLPARLARYMALSARRMASPPDSSAPTCATPALKVINTFSLPDR